MKITLMGAGGKMGCRVGDNLRQFSQHDIAYVEVSDAGIARLTERGLTTTSQSEAIANCDAVVLALPDKVIGTVCHQIVPELSSGALIIGLDPAAGYAGVLPKRDDIAYFVAHPCHPPVMSDEVTPEAQSDYFGGEYAKQDIVCSLIQGSEADYENGETIARVLYAPVMNSYRITLEQMAILEPALVETTVLTCLLEMRKAMDKAVDMGVPADAAKSFMMGHLRVLLAIVFDYVDFPVSDGAKLAADVAAPIIFQPDWVEQIFNIEAVQASVTEIVSGE
ncbi:MAG: phosphogluconate dehydrogenase C-terminal domain-containing protein [Chloroflexota bacterium]